MSDDKEKRARCYFPQRSYYYETHDKDGNVINMETEQEWKERVTEEWSDLTKLIAKSIAFIFHDNDIDENGVPKGLHVHAVVEFDESIEQSKAVNRLGCSSEQNCQSVSDKVDSYRYLIHVSESALNKCKFIYPVSAVTCLTTEDKPFELEKLMSRSKDKGSKVEKESDCLHKVRTGELTLNEVRSYYETDKFKLGWSLSKWYKVKSMFKNAEAEYIADTHYWYQSHRRCLTTVFINGAGLMGKSSVGLLFGNRHADKRGIHKVAVKGCKTTFDFAGDYHGEKVTFFNELSGHDTFSVDQFNDIFDPINANRANSRNDDKPWFANYVIFTTSINVEGFIYQMWYPHASKEISLDFSKYRHITNERILECYEGADANITDKIRQIRRRIAIYVELTEDKAYIYIRNDKYNVAHIFKYDTPKAGEEPYQLLYSMDYSPTDNDKITNVVNAIEQAIPEYYRLNAYSVTPWNVEKPLLA